MTNKEKVIKGLELCSREKGQTIGCLLDCPYDDEEGCRKKVMRDALALLKAQEPRVMTLEELALLPTDAGENTPVWMETRVVTDRGVLTWLEASILWTVEDGWWRRFGPVHSGWEDRRADAYGVTWRCWNVCPTDEQREAAAWE